MIRFRRTEGGFLNTGHEDFRSSRPTRNFQAALEAAIAERQEQERRRQPRTASNPSYVRTESGGSLAWVRTRGAGVAPSDVSQQRPPQMPPQTQAVHALPAEVVEWLAVESKPRFKKSPPRAPRILDYRP